jgi:hypothetical protein
VLRRAFLQRQRWLRNHHENCTTEHVSEVEIIEPRRGNSGRWLTSGNPGGLTHEHRDLLKLFRDKCPDAANVLYDIMMDPKAPYTVRAFCAANWIDRAIGKPRAQSAEVDQKGRSLESMLTEIWQKREAKAQESAEVR